MTFTEFSDFAARVIVPVVVAWLAYRHRRCEHELNILYAKERERQNGKCWTKQMRKPFRLFRKW